MDTERRFNSEWDRQANPVVYRSAKVSFLTLRDLNAAVVRPVQMIDASGQSWLVMHSLYPVDDRLGVEDFLSGFLTKIESLFDLVRSDADKGAIFISCPVEWVNLRSNTNVLEQNVDLGNMAQLEHEIYWATAFEPSLAGSEGIMRCHDVLQTNAAENFPGAWTPALITLYVRYSHLIKYGSVNPDEIIAAVNALKKPDDQSSAQLLAFLLGVALGSNKVHTLERLLHPEGFKIAKSHSDQIVESAKINGDEN